MTEYAIIKKNKDCKEELLELESHKQQIDAEIAYVKSELVAPCKFCDYQGAIRCGLCKDWLYEGFNNKEWF